MRVQIYVIKKKKKKKDKQFRCRKFERQHNSLFSIDAKNPLKLSECSEFSQFKELFGCYAKKKKKKKKIKCITEKDTNKSASELLFNIPPPAIDWGRDSRIRWLHLDREVRTPPHNECPRYDTKLYLMVRFQSRCFGNEKYPFMVITLRFTLSRIGNTC